MGVDNKQMITLHVITSLGSGGAEGMLKRLVLHSYKHKHVVVSLIDRGTHGDTMTEKGIDVHELNLQNPKNWISGIIKLNKIIKKEKPNIIMSWLYHADFISFILVKIFHKKIKLIWNIRCSNIDLSQYSPMTRFILYSNKFFSRFVDLIITNSHSGRIFHQQIGYKNSNWMYIPNGIDTCSWSYEPEKKARALENLLIQPSCFVIFCIARFDPQKDHETLIKSFQYLKKEYKRTKLILIGKNTDKIPIPNEIINDVISLGERSDIPLLMQAANLVVLTSAYGEGFPNVLGEALATGTHCIATDVGDTRMLLSEVGTVIPPKNPEILFEEIRNCIENEKISSESEKHKRRKFIIDNFSIEKIVNQYDDLIGKASIHD